ncbi:MAG: carboxypeptidase-like regulatory domain-containing protein [Tenuifilaceae bacterium]
MKQTILIILVFFPYIILAQIQGIVKDKKTRNPIEYANIWLENQNSGTTSDLEGKFKFKEKSIGKVLIISAIGYETQHFKIEEENVIIELIPKTYEIKELLISPKKNNKEVVIDKYDKSSINYFFGCGTYPWIVAKYFEFLPAYEQTPYLKKLTILTNSRKKPSSFNLRLISVNEIGEPSTDILKENLVIKAKRGKRNTTVDLSEYSIKFPKEGFFIAVEWLIIEDNMNEFEFTVAGSKKKVVEIRYEPLFGSSKKERDFDNWTYSNGSWHKSKIAPPSRMDKAGDLAIELTISN